MGCTKMGYQDMDEKKHSYIPRKELGQKLATSQEISCEPTSKPKAIIHIQVFYISGRQLIANHPFESSQLEMNEWPKQLFVWYFPTFPRSLAILNYLHQRVLGQVG